MDARVLTSEVADSSVLWISSGSDHSYIAVGDKGVSGSEDEEGETVEQSYTVEVSGKRFDVKVIGPPFAGGHASNGSVK